MLTILSSSMLSPLLKGHKMEVYQALSCLPLLTNSSLLPCCGNHLLMLSTASSSPAFPRCLKQSHSPLPAHLSTSSSPRQGRALSQEKNSRVAVPLTPPPDLTPSLHLIRQQQAPDLVARSQGLGVTCLLAEESHH